MQFQGNSNSSFTLDRMVFLALMVCIAFVLLIAKFYWGFVFFLVMPIYFFRGSGVDFVEDKYLEYTSIFGYKFGSWKTMPPVLYILIKDTRFVSQESSADVNDGNVVSDTYEVAVVCENRVKIVVLYSPDANSAIQTVNSALEYFKCNLRDMTHEQLMETPEANW